MWQRLTAGTITALYEISPKKEPWEPGTGIFQMALNIVPVKPQLTSTKTT